MAHPPPPRPVSRREMLSRCACGFGSVALLGMFGSLAACSGGQGRRTAGATPRPGGGIMLPGHLPRARHIIFLYMDGGVSQVDSFDPKPRLQAESGQDPAAKFKVDATQFNNVGRILPSPWAFRRYGASGLEVSDLFPHIGSCADDIAVIRSMVSDFPEHTNANYFLHTGSGLQGRPSMGAWVNYGLGTENDNLPGYVVLDGGLIPPGGLDNFKNGFLPAGFQASILRSGAEPLANIRPIDSIAGIQERKLAFLDRQDRQLLQTVDGAGDAIESAIRNYELAYRMQSSIPELTEFGEETEATKKLYGMDSPDPHTRNYAAQCLLARRLVERGVRFIELTCPQTDGTDRWDQHGNLKAGHEANAHAVDQPIAGLLKDLKRRGLLDQTLVVWTGEFGRTPFAQGTDGRDHNPSAFSMWMAGGGVRGGIVHGRTDDYGYRVVEDPVTIHDLHATLLHLLGVNHKELTFHFGGRDFRLTDVHGHVVHDILA
jgi:hypothetical protein